MWDKINDLVDALAGYFCVGCALWRTFVEHKPVDDITNLLFLGGLILICKWSILQRIKRMKD